MDTETYSEHHQVRYPDLTDLALKGVEQYDIPDALELLVHQMLIAPDVKIAQWLLESIPEEEWIPEDE